MGTTALAERLRGETRELHSEAERSGVMAALLQGRLSLASYCALLRNLHAIYSALEAAQRARRDDPMIAALHSPALLREAALTGDLERLHGAAWRQELLVRPATAEYVERLRGIAAAGSVALVAHVYVRYLGDLHGGQILKRRIVKQFGPWSEGGTRFYDFGSEPATMALRQAFRAGLSGLRPSASDADVIVAEARWAFEQHKVLFDELQAAA